VNKVSIQNFFHNLAHMDVSTFYLYLLVILYPALPGYFGVFGFSVYSILAACALLFLPLSSKMRNFKFSPSVMLALFLILSLVCLGPAVNGEVLTPTFLNYLNAFFLLPFYIAVVGSDKKTFEHCLNLILGVAVVLCLFSFLELANFNIFSLLQTDFNTTLGPGTGKRYGIYRSESSFGQSIAFAVYLNFMCCLTFYKIKKNNTHFSIVYFLMTLLFNICCLLTISRFPILIMVLIDLVGFFFSNKKFKVFFGVTALLGVLSGLLFGFIRGGGLFSSLIDNLIHIFSGTAGTDLGDNPLLYRFNLFSALSEVLGGNWFFGNGMLSQYGFVYPKTFWPVVRNSFDNTYLYLIENFGILGLIGWLAYYIFPFFLKFGDSPLDRWKKVFFIILSAVLLLNFLSVARLAENRSFVVLFGLLIGQSSGHFTSHQKYAKSNLSFYKIKI
jgi:hypothetical protein